MEKFVLTDPKSLAYWEKTADLVDQFIDIPLNYRQSGHPGGVLAPKSTCYFP